ncbi:hypothetical protein [Streptacidiphilus sp. EB129]|uniref:hypothetical protein n=1 Tax=Streptacidiphilus sp. EB129 TaxID=3156262 RepID=UPI003515A572
MPTRQRGRVDEGDQPGELLQPRVPRQDISSAVRAQLGGVPAGGPEQARQVHRGVETQLRQRLVGVLARLQLTEEERDLLGQLVTQHLHDPARRRLLQVLAVLRVIPAAASGKTLGRPAVLTGDRATDAVEAYREGAAVKGLARQYGVSPRTIRRALDAAGARDLPDTPELPGDTVGAEPAQQLPAPGTAVVLDVPGLLADHLRGNEDAAVREVLRAGRTVRRGQGYSVRVAAPLALHQVVLAQCAALAGEGGTPAGRKACRAYADRIAGAVRTS